MNLDGGKLKLSRGSLIVARKNLGYSLYKLQAKIAGHGMNVANHNSSPNLWHR